MLYLSLMLGIGLIVFTRVMTSSMNGGNIDLDGVVRRPMPTVNGSLVLSGRHVHVAIGAMSYRHNRVYYRLAVSVK